jgi:hypothetical protein
MKFTLAPLRRFSPSGTFHPCDAERAESRTQPQISGAGLRMPRRAYEVHPYCKSRSIYVRFACARPSFRRSLYIPLYRLSLQCCSSSPPPSTTSSTINYTLHSTRTIQVSFPCSPVSSLPLSPSRSSFPLRYHAAPLKLIPAMGSRSAQTAQPLQQRSATQSTTSPFLSTT